MIRLERAAASVPGRSRAEPPRTLLDALDAEFRAGESHLVLGANGSGKSTLIRLLAGLRPPASGRALLDGKPYAAGRAGVWPAIAVLFEEPDPQFLSDTVEGEIAFGLESLALAPEIIRTRTTEAMDRFGLARFRDRAPWSLSGGEKARVLLAAALAAEPRALLLDQSLAHLDPSTRRSLERGLVAEALGGARLLVRTHQDWDSPGAGEVLHVIEQGALRRVDLTGPGPWNTSVPYPLALRAAAILRTRGCWDGPLATTTAELGVGIRRTAGVCEAEGAREGVDPARSRGGHTASPPVPSAGGDPVIALSSVSWSPGGRGPRLLAPLDLEVRQGEVVALVGRSGSGKSTVLKLAAGLLDPASGSVTIRGRPGPGRPAGLALEYPERQLFGRTVGEDVAALLWVAGVAERERRDRARAALATVGLDPDAFEARVPATLSEGEKRRAAIAALLADAPTALLLDEPTAGLDPEGRASLARVIETTRAEGRAVLLASHDLDFVSSVADRVVLLARDREGEAAALATRSPREVWSDPQLLERAGLPAPDFLEVEKTLRGAGLVRGSPARDGAALLGALERCMDALLRRSAPGNPASVGSEA